MKGREQITSPHPTPSIWYHPLPRPATDLSSRNGLGTNQALGQKRPNRTDNRQQEREQHDGKGKRLFPGGQLVPEEFEVEGQGEANIKIKSVT